MPITKETSARLVKRSITHDAISREVVQTITNPVALAIYTYLLTKPPNWTVRRQEIIDHFDGLGRDRYDQGMTQLRELGLVWTAKIQGEDGRFLGNEIVVEQTFDRSVGKPAIRENPTLGKSDHLKKKRLSTEEENGVRGWDQWVEFRAEIKKKITPKSEKQQLALLKPLTPEHQYATIMRSIQNGWQGLFPEKEKPNGNTKQHTGTTHNTGRRETVGEQSRRLREEARQRAAARSPDMGHVEPAG